MIRVLVVAETPLMGDIVAGALADEADVDVVGEVTTTDDAVAGLAGCDVALVSTSLPDGGALALTRKATETAPSVKVVVLGLPESGPVVLEYVEAGAAGYVPTDASLDELITHLRAVHRGQALIPPHIAAAMISRIKELSAPARSNGRSLTQKPAALTPREVEVLELIDRGLSNQDIAQHLVIEVGTVKNHVHSILSKLDADNRHQAAKYLSLVDAA